MDVYPETQNVINVTTGVQFVNPRDGRKPASIKGTDGSYYTISDAGFEKYNEMQGFQVEISYTEKQGNPNYPPFRNVTHLNGEPMPRDARIGAPALATTNVQPMVQPTPRSAPVPAPSRPGQRLDVPPGICGILKSSIEAGLPRQEAVKWIAIGLNPQLDGEEADNRDERPAADAPEEVPF